MKEQWGQWAQRGARCSVQSDGIASQTPPFLLLVRALEAFLVPGRKIACGFPLREHLQAGLVPAIKNRLKLAELHRAVLSGREQRASARGGAPEIVSLERTSCTGIGIYQQPAMTFASARVLTLDTLLCQCVRIRPAQQRRQKERV